MNIKEYYETQHKEKFTGSFEDKFICWPAIMAVVGSFVIGIIVVLIT